jgi:Sap, sulfolipid-1-addressing protein
VSVAQPSLATGANSFLDLLPMALWSAFYPTLLAVVVLILARPNPRRLLVAYYAGGLLVSFAAAALLIEAFKAGHSVGASNKSLSPGVDIAGGVVALALFWVLLTDRDRRLRERRERRKEAKLAQKEAGEADDRDPWSQRLLQRDSLGLTFAVALVLNLPGAMYLVALKDIAESDAGTPRIMFGFIEVPILGYLLSPDATKRRVEAMHHWLGTPGRHVAMTLCVTAGGFLVARGLIGAL